MKITIVVVGTLFVILVLGYLFQQKGLKEGWMDDDDIPRINPQPYIDPGPGDSNHGDIIGVGSGGDNYPVNTAQPEPLRYHGLTDRNWLSRTDGPPYPDGPPYTITDTRTGRTFTTSDTPEGLPLTNAGYSHTLPGVPGNETPVYRILDPDGNPTDSLYVPDKGMSLDSPDPSSGLTDPYDEDAYDDDYLDPNTVHGSTDDVL